MIHLACLRGNIGFWTFYSTVIKVKDIVTENRIITVTESEELYTQNINRILQREIKQNRINAISKYFEMNDERFFNSLIVAIHKGTPKWTDVDIFEKMTVENNPLKEEEISFLSSKYGILSLTGDEQIFALDGQHRLKGIRKAFKDQPNLSDVEIPVIFVIHNHDNVDKTRRLFTVLNKYAEKPRGAELIILDEDDVAAINARRLVIEHPVLSRLGALSSSKTGAIPASDNSSFTTLVTIYNINKRIYNLPKSFYASRPGQTEIDELYEKSMTFWSLLFESFPSLVEYIDGLSDVKIDGKSICRNDLTGGSLLLRPVGQELIANAFAKFSNNELGVFKNRISQVDFNLSSNIWKYLFWNEKMLGKEIKLKNNLLLFLLGKYNNVNEIHREMARVYRLNNQPYNNHIIPMY
ncbi:MAG: DNA sulfur modification protein DndB [Bacteroidales bacterium]